MPSLRPQAVFIIQILSLKFDQLRQEAAAAAGSPGAVAETGLDQVAQFAEGAMILDDLEERIVAEAVRATRREDDAAAGRRLRSRRGSCPDGSARATWQTNCAVRSARRRRPSPSNSRRLLASSVAPGPA